MDEKAIFKQEFHYKSNHYADKYFEVEGFLSHLVVTAYSDSHRKPSRIVRTFTLSFDKNQHDELYLQISEEGKEGFFFSSYNFSEFALTSELYIFLAEETIKRYDQLSPTPFESINNRGLAYPNRYPWYSFMQFPMLRHEVFLMQETERDSRDKHPLISWDAEQLLSLLNRMNDSTNNNLVTTLLQQSNSLDEFFTGLLGHESFQSQADYDLMKVASPNVLWDLFDWDFKGLSITELHEYDQWLKVVAMKIPNSSRALLKLVFSTSKDTAETQHLLKALTGNPYIQFYGMEKDKPALRFPLEKLSEEEQYSLASDLRHTLATSSRVTSETFLDVADKWYARNILTPSVIVGERVTIEAISNRFDTMLGFQMPLLDLRLYFKTRDQLNYVVIAPIEDQKSIWIDLEEIVTGHHENPSTVLGWSSDVKVQLICSPTGGYWRVPNQVAPHTYVWNLIEASQEVIDNQLTELGVELTVTNRNYYLQLPVALRNMPEAWKYIAIGVTDINHLVLLSSDETIPEEDKESYAHLPEDMFFHFLYNKSKTEYLANQKGKEQNGDMGKLNVRYSS